MPYYLSTEEANEASLHATAEHRKSVAESLPPEAIELDRSVAASILDILQSDKGTPFMEHLQAARETMLRDKSHAQISYVFRSSFIFLRCRELWRFILTRDQGIQFVKSSGGLNRTCQKCGTAYGYPLPHMHIDKWVSRGSKYAEQIVTEEIQNSDKVLSADITQMRADGLFDDAMRLTVKTLKQLRLAVFDYGVIFVSIHHLKDGRVAISPSGQIDSMEPGLVEPRSTYLRRPREYFAPCEHCKGEGCVSEAM